MENNKQLITLITICSRPQNLDKIWDSIKQQKYNKFNWIISFDSEEIPTLNFKDNRIKLLNYKNKETDITNYAALNNLFNSELINDSFIHILDDDNILFPNYLHTINNNIEENIKLLLYNQIYKDNNIRFNIKTKDIKECKIDIAQACFHTSIIQDFRFIQKYTADGIFYEELFNSIKSDKSKWKIINQPLCYYNFLSDNNKLDSINRQKMLYLYK
jgi:hypothetical protein